MTERTKIIFLANPNNPTGTLLPEAEVRRLHAGLPSHILVLDWAYAEYVADGMSMARMVEAFENVVMFRTFSKMHGLAAQRLGWGYFPSKIRDVLASIRPPFSINTIANVMGIAAIEDRAFKIRALPIIKNGKENFQKRMAEIGLSVNETHANFFLIDFSGHNVPSAKQAVQFMSDKGILLREMVPYKLDDYLRISIGTDEEMEIVLSAFQELMEKNQ